MEDKSKIVFEHVKSYMGYYLTIIAVIGSLWMIFIFYDKWKDEKTQMRNEINTLKQEQKDHRRLDSLLLEEQYKLQTRLSAIESKTDIQGKDIKGVKTSVVRYVSQDEALTREDFVRFILEINGDSSVIHMYPYLLPKNKTKKSK
jgi:hypothetical protein